MSVGRSESCRPTPRSPGQTQRLRHRASVEVLRQPRDLWIGRDADVLEKAGNAGGCPLWAKVLKLVYDDGGL